MHSDVQISAGGTSPVPLDYLLPGAADFILKAVHATFTDNGASGDWLPCVTILSDSGAVIARAADQGVKVTAGSDAGVSWFPGVKHAAAGGAATFYGGQLFAWRESLQTITSGVATALAFDVDFANGDASTVFSHGGSPWSSWQILRRAGSINHASAATACLIVEWQSAFAGDRYAEIALTAANDPWMSDEHPARKRDSGTPNGDIQTVSRDCYDRIITGSGTYRANVFQASGVNQIVHASLSLLEQSNFLPA